MKLGTVVGPLCTAKAAPGYETANWVQLRTQQGIEVALDPIGVKPGQTVVFASGQTASRYQMDTGTDAVVVSLVQ